MKDNLQPSLKLIFGSEGGYSNHPKDPGGPTKYGITLATLAAYRKKECTEEDVKELTIQEATDIYGMQYAQPIRFDELPSGLDYAVLDYAINSGPAQAIKSLQKCLGVEHDGVVGAKTLAALTGVDVEARIVKLCATRLEFMKALKTWSTFGRGWESRVKSVQRNAIRLASVTPMPAPVAVAPVEGGDAKASPSSTAVVSTAPGKRNIGVIVGGGVAAIPVAVAALTPYGDEPWVHHVLPVLAALGAAGTVLIGVLGLKATSDTIDNGTPR